MFFAVQIAHLGPDRGTVKLGGLEQVYHECSLKSL